MMKRNSGQSDSSQLVDKLLGKNDTLIPGNLTFIQKELQSTSEQIKLDNLSNLFGHFDDPSVVPLLEPHLASTDADIASGALSALCRLGQAERLKPYIMEAADTGFSWDTRRKVARAALRGAGLHLKTHRDRDLAQLLMRWAPAEGLDDLLDRSLPAGSQDPDTGYLARDAAQGMIDAIGADAKSLLDDDVLYAACVRRFRAERQDG